MISIEGLWENSQRQHWMFVGCDHESQAFCSHNKNYSAVRPVFILFSRNIYVYVKK